MSVDKPEPTGGRDSAQAPLDPGAAEVSAIVIRGRRFERVVIRTHWIGPGEDIGDLVERYIAPHRRVGDCLFLSEKALVVARGDVIPASTVKAGFLAKTLTRWVRPIGDSRGLSIPEKMQLVIESVGVPRVLVAAAAAALTRPLGIRGAFYVVAGDVARGIDGMRPPLEDMLIPPLASQTARATAAQLARRLAMPVAIADLNDRGGSIRAVSGPELDPRSLGEVLGDNPLGQRDRQTPIGLLRPRP